MKTRYLVPAFILAAGAAIIGDIAVEIDHHAARTGADIDLHADLNMGGMYGAFDYKPNPEERALINEPR